MQTEGRERIGGDETGWGQTDGYGGIPAYSRREEEAPGKDDGTIHVYLPAIIGKGYRDFWNCRKRYRVVKGGKGSKKSATTALWYIVHLMKYPQANLLVVRAVYATLRDSCFAQLLWAIRRLGVERWWQAAKSPLELTYRPTGQKILFRGFDNPDKLASTTVEQGVLCWVWVEEAFELSSEEAFDKLDLSAPRGAVSPPLFKQTTLTFNPWSGRHWLKRRFFDREDDRVFTLTTTYRVNEFLDEADRTVFERMERENPRRYQVAGLGEWGSQEGLVFENWVVEPFDSLPEEGGRHVFGLDYGYTNDPTAFVAMAVYPAEKVLYVYDEHYETRMLNDAIAAMIRKKGYAKERIRADAAEPKSNDDLRRLGISRLIPAAKGPDSVRNGIARLQEYRMIVHSRCVHTAEELAAYVWENDPGGGTLNRPRDADNHLMDAMRYAMEDIRPSRADLPPKPVRRYRTDGGVRAADLRGAWDGR